VGWGGATDQDVESSGVVYVGEPGAAATFEGCTLQYHPDSQHVPLVAGQGFAVQGRPGAPMPSSLVVADHHGCVDLSECQLVGPAFSGAARTGFGVRTGTNATINLVGVW
jgi:hypothetical protein